MHTALYTMHEINRYSRPVAMHLTTDPTTDI